MRENAFQANLKKELKVRFPGCYVLKNDPTNCQGIPDLLVLWHERWAMLECKRSNTASKRPNQSRRVEELNKMSFAKFINPENKDEVLDELEQAFRNPRR